MSLELEQPSKSFGPFDSTDDVVKTAMIGSRPWSPGDVPASFDNKRKQQKKKNYKKKAMQEQM